MTRDEAICRFENVKVNALIQKQNGVSEYWQQEIDGTIEAIDMAIEALSEPKWACTANFVAEQLERLKQMTDEERLDFLKRFFSPSAEQVTGKLKNPCDSLLKDDSDGCKEHKSKLDHGKEWIIGCIKHDGFIHTERFDKANQIILDALEAPSGDFISREDAIEALEKLREEPEKYYTQYNVGVDCSIKALSALPTADRPTGKWISEVDTGTWMLKCSVCGCRVQEEKYRIAVGTAATKCPYCGAELGLGGYTYDDYADRPSQRGGNK